MTNQAPPEGQLIANAQKRLGLSARKAAAAAGISDSRWRHIINGYQPVGQGQTIPVRAPADTLARMASVVGVTPKELAVAGRADAAEELHQIFPADSPWVNLARAVEPRIVELGFASAREFAKSRGILPDSIEKVVAGIPVGKPAFYRALEKHLLWQPGSVASACQGAPPIRVVGSPGSGAESGSALAHISNADLLAEVARRFTPDESSGLKPVPSNLDDPDNYDLAAHPDIPVEADRIDSEFDQLGEESQDTEDDMGE